MKQNIFPALKLTLVCLLFFSGFYTLLIFGIAQFSPNNGKGEILTVGNKKYYSNVGQAFTENKYFWSRPSAVDYNAASAAGTNKGPSNPDYLKTVQDRIDNFIKYNPEIRKAEIPSDLVTASGSGLDPNISVQAANVQVKRIAKIRNLNAFEIQKLIVSKTEKPFLNLFGTEKINVLKLNVALDGLN